MVDIFVTRYKPGMKLPSRRSLGFDRKIMAKFQVVRMCVFFWVIFKKTGMFFFSNSLLGKLCEFIQIIL